MPADDRNFSDAPLATLPDELLLSVLQHFPPFQLRGDRSAMYRTFTAAQKVEKSNRVRKITLRSLSQACFSLRRFFLPYSWEFLINNDMYNGGAASDDFVSVKSQLTFPIVVAPEVCRAIDLVVSVHYGILPILRESLSLMNCVHTLRLDDNSETRTHTEEVNHVFKHSSFPWIQKLLLAPSFWPLMRCCRSVKHIESIGLDEDQVFMQYAASCRQLESLKLPYFLPGSGNLGGIHAQHPKLRRIRFTNIGIQEGSRKSLQLFQKLQTVEFTRIIEEEEIEESEKGALSFLMDHFRTMHLEDKENKKIIIHDSSGKRKEILLLFSLKDQSPETWQRRAQSGE